MTINEFSIKPTLEINKSKEFENISSVIVDTLKTGRGSVVNIVTNKEISKDDKIYLLQQENLKLLDALSELKDKIKELQNEFNYQHYLLWAKEHCDIKLDTLLIEKNIDYKRVSEKSHTSYIHYYVNKKDWKSFLECVKEYNNQE